MMPVCITSSIGGFGSGTKENDTFRLISHCLNNVGELLMSPTGGFNET